MTKGELCRSCWPDTTVSQTVLRVCIREIRAVLGPEGQGTISIESVGRRGYRLLSHAGDADGAPRPLIGRERELGVPRRALARAGDGLRQVVLLSGEAGLGKTTLVEHWRRRSRSRAARR